MANPLNIYLLKRLTDRPTHDVMDSCVVVTKDEPTARDWATTRCGDEGPDVWINSRWSECILLGFADDTIREGLHCRNFNAG